MKLSEQQKKETIEMLGDYFAEEIENVALESLDIYQLALEFCTLLAGADFVFEASFLTWRISHRELADKLIKTARDNGLTIKMQIIDNIIVKFAKIMGIEYPPENNDDSTPESIK